MIANPTPPNLSELLDNLRQEISVNLNCHEVGIIESFDATKQTATVQVAVLRILVDKQIPYPILTDCPVFVPAGADGCLTFPIEKGDTCLVLFNDRDLDNWFDSGSVVAPNSSRTHSLSDGLVLVGFRNKANPVADYSTTDAEFRKGDTTVGLDGEKISVRNADTTLRAQLDQLFVNLDNLCSALTSWVNTGGSTPNPATVTAINAVKTAIGNNKTAMQGLLK